MASIPVPTGPAIAKLVESGIGRAENELPIDINYQKLAEWLVTRKKMPNDWHKRVQAIQAKITEAAKDLPPGLLAQLPGGADAPIDYFRAVQIRDNLAENAERTLFGGLTGAAGLWDNIVKAYEKQNVFMGEAASNMVSNVDYELPYLRKQAARYSQLISDADRKSQEYIKSAATCASNFKQECGRLGIQGTNVRSELLQLGRQLPAMFQEIIKGLRAEQLGEAIAYYRHFVAYAHSGNSGSQQQLGQSASSLPDVLPNLTEVREGRTAPPAERRGQQAGGGGIEIDWDAGGLGDSSGQLGGNAAAEAGGGGDIDWDLDLSDLVVAPADDGGNRDAGGDAAVGGGGDEEPGACGPLISWDIELTEAAAEDLAAAPGAAASPNAAADGGVTTAAADEEPQAEAAALRLEADHEYRSLLLDDLQELRAFLVQRAAELGSGGGGGSADLLNALLPPEVAAVDARGAGRLLASVQAALASLEAPELRQLLLIAGSGRYLDRLARELMRKAGQEEKMLAAASEVDARRHESRAALAALAPRSAALADRTRAAQRAVEASLSSQLSRRVNILGEINNTLATVAAAVKQQQQQQQQKQQQ